MLGLTRYVGIDRVCYGMLDWTDCDGIEWVCWDYRGMLGLTGYVGIDWVCWD